MSVEPSIALEAALADLSALYPVARGFTALQDAAEHELLPFLSRLGAALRSLQRKHGLDDAAAQSAATAILGESARWHEALEALHTSAAYRAALDAWQANDQGALARCIPSVLAGHTPIDPVPPLYFPFAISSGRRRPGSSPFLSPQACADAIDTLAIDGICCEPCSGPWWDRELQPLVCAADALALASPITLRKAIEPRSLSVFAVADELTLRVFSPIVRGPFSVVLAAEAEDEWWEAYEDSYQVFRDRLHRELQRRQRDVELLPSHPL